MSEQYCPRCQQWDHTESDHGITCPACAEKDAEIADLQALIAKRARVRVSVHDVWLRERERREKADAEIARLRALVDVGREMAGVLQYLAYPSHENLVARWRSLEGKG